MTTTTQISRLNAFELLKQLGGNRFIAMTGAHQFVRGVDNIVFKIGRNSANINYVRITLNAADLYDMEFINIRAGVIKVKAVDNDIYCDQLQSTFTTRTGMYTGL